MRTIGIAVAAVLMLVLSGVFFFRRKAPAFPVTPVSVAPRVLTTSEVLQTLGSDLRVFRTVNQIPEVVKEDYETLTGAKFWMVNPGQKMSTDAILPNVPSKRVVFLALGWDREVLLFERGGFVSNWDVMIVVHGALEGAWCASLDNYHVVDTLEILQKTIQAGKFTREPDCFRMAHSYR